MDFEELLEKRRSVRAFSSTPVSEGELAKIWNAANSAPSAGNLQAFTFYIVTDERTKGKLAEICYGQQFIATVPVVFVFFSEPARSSRKYGERGASLYSVLDAAIAAAYAQLEVANLGLGSVWVGAFEDAPLQQLFRNRGQPVCVLPVGRPAGKTGKVEKEDRGKTPQG
jgi:nitroreductase